MSQHAYVDLQKEPNMFLQLTTTDESAEQAYRMEGLNAYIDNTVSEINLDLQQVSAQILNPYSEKDHKKDKPKP